ncbi:MAG: pantoate--beta-alanine ligase [Flavobacteriaceae bacterium]|nr:pantoate--beta-alanine ligase [Flavobacteriaceae bacterium]
MKLFTEKSSLQEALASSRESIEIGFVPTMGALHNGHISLVKQAIAENDKVVVSIFVNPTQFDRASDLALYPRTLESDLELLNTVSQDLFIYAPEVKDIYTNGVVAKKYHYGSIQNEMEGKHREGHFDGVGTIVSALLRAVSPNRAYFGEKDFQQLQIIKKLVQIEGLSTQIISCPIMREENGLAMSSRNKRLSPKLYNEASLIYKVLQEVRSKFNEFTIPQLNLLVKKRFDENEHLNLEYFEIAAEKTLKTAKRKHRKTTYRAFLAVYADEVRLIDNLQLN